jgi:D-alanyl-D-alanine carboxypeptidase/D-alanyl-D-alanine-endopeptidase (penicillin-binding protein 4)
MRLAAGAAVVALVVLSACGGAGTSRGDGAALPESIREIMAKPRYEDATWSLLVADVETGETFYSLNPERLSFTGSTRKLFSVGLALDTLGAGHREETPVYRLGEVGADGTLRGDLALVGAGDLTFGGRRIDADTVEATHFDHNDANQLGTAELTPQDPLYALDELARQVRAAGIASPELKAQNLAGYIETSSGRLVAYALMANDVGALEDFEADISGVLADEARISSIIYETL